MTSPLPAHLATAIRERIALLRKAWHLDQAPSHPRLAGYPSARPRREPRRRLHVDDPRRTS